MDVIEIFKLGNAIEIPPIPLPAALNDVVAGAFSTTQLQVGWTDPGDLASSYQIDYSTDPTFATFTTAPLAPSTPGAGGIAIISGLNLVANNYYVRIKAVNASGGSAFAYADFYTPAPDAITSLSATPISANQINVSFTDPGEWATQYEVERSLSAGFTSPSSVFGAANPLGPSTINLTGLLPTTIYYLRVRAINGALVSAWQYVTETTL